ncbi:MAG: MucBP domain-containing protein [Provencibacterium sp.]|jgi:hypothetical protein|nr:MucBP domain-containing protein [Provencibacterium sp.]
MKKLLSAAICAFMLFAFSSPVFAATVTKVSLGDRKPKVIFEKMSDNYYRLKSLPDGFRLGSGLSEDKLSSFYSDWNAFLTGSTERIGFISLSELNKEFSLIMFDAGPITCTRKTTIASHGGFYYELSGQNGACWEIGFGGSFSSSLSSLRDYFILSSSSYFSFNPNLEIAYHVPENFLSFDHLEIMEEIDFYSSNLFPKTSYTLTINYQYADGSEAASPVTQLLETGETYSIPSPEIEGYQPDKAAVSGIMPDGGHAETVVYTPVKPSEYTLTINYQYENGVQAAPPYVESLAPGSAYSVDSPVLENCIADLLTVSGTMPEENLTLTVTYTSEMYPLTIRYQYSGGLQASPSVTRHLAAGSSYSIPSPVISGYTANPSTVSGTMPPSPLSVTVIYSRSSSGGNPGEGGGDYDPFDSPAWWQDFDDPFDAPPLWQYFSDPFNAPAWWQDFDDPFDAPPLWQDFSNPFDAPALYQDFDDPFEKIFGRSFLDVEGEDP